MNERLTTETLDSIEDLTSKEIRKILEHCSEEQKLRVADLARKMNQNHLERIQQNKTRIELEIQTNRILLQKCWRCLDEKTKPECAAIFKEIWDRIAEDH